jgi:transcriptional regulator with XRE-family HTH domain
VSRSESYICPCAFSRFNAIRKYKTSKTCKRKKFGAAALTQAALDETVEKDSILTERDKAIAARLLKFREETRIPRTVFALSLGIGGERLASYEKARVRLKYSVVHRMIEQYKLSPLWLATGEGQSFMAFPFDESDISQSVPANALFTWVFDNFLRDRIKGAAFEAARNFQTLVNSAWDSTRRLKDPYFAKALSAHDLHRLLDAEERLVLGLRSLLGIGSNEPIGARLLKQNLTNTGEPVNSSPVAKGKTLVENLIAEVKALTEARGARTKLARHLGVTPQRLNDWLSGEHEPSAETTLALNAWVNDPAEQQKTLQDALNIPKGKVTRKKSPNEKLAGHKSKRKPPFRSHFP